MSQINKTKEIKKASFSINCSLSVHKLTTYMYAKVNKSYQKKQNPIISGYEEKEKKGVATFSYKIKTNGGYCVKNTSKKYHCRRRLTLSNINNKSYSQ